MIHLAIAIFAIFFIIPYLLVSMLLTLSWIIEKLIWEPIEQISSLFKKGS